jgi:DNA-binding XRE family transcriptional regulator
MKMKIYDFDDLLKEQLKDPEFRKEYDALEEEFEVAKEVIRMRLKAKMTQKTLAEKAQTSQSCIARLESGSYRNVSLSFLRRVGSAFGVKPHVTFQKPKLAH